MDPEYQRILDGLKNEPVKQIFIIDSDYYY